MNSMILHPLPLAADYSPDPPNCSVQQSQFPTPNDGIRNTSVTQPANTNHLNNVRCGLVDSETHDLSYTNGQHISDSGSASLSTSPSSNASSLAYSSHSTATLYGSAQSVQSVPSVSNPYPTASQVFPSQYPLGYSLSGMSHARPRLASITHPSSGILNPIRSPPVPVTPTSSSMIRDHYQTATPGLNRHYFSPRSNFQSVGRSTYYATETPRSTMMSTPSGMLPPTQYSSPVTLADSRSNESPPFLDHERFHDLYADGQQLNPTIDAKVEKGFFMSTDGCWTCYRRNYFSVQCSYSLSPHPASRPIYLIKRGEKTQHQVQAMAVSLSAAVDGAAGKVIELVQHTPKRDRGPQTTVAIVKLSPTTPGSKMPHLPHGIAQGYPMDGFGQASNQLSPYLPLQSQVDSSTQAAQSDADSGYMANMTPPTAHQHTFERIQFKSATANNGKRRAQQQYYHLIIELYADIRKTMDKDPKWVKIAQRVSTAVVVRGRSPSHYQNEGPNSARSTGAPGGSSAGLGLGSMLRSAQDGSFGGSLSYGSGMGGHSYRGGNTYMLESSPVGSYTTSSVSTDTTGDNRAMILAPTTTHELKSLTSIDSYHSHYYAPTLYNTELPNPARMDQHTLHYDAKARGDVTPAFPPGGLAAAWQAGGCGRIQGLPPSRSLFPSVDASY